MPVFNYNVLDTMGSGDAFFSISSLISRLSDDQELITFMGNVAGSLKVSIEGHSKNIDYINLRVLDILILNLQVSKKQKG